jgi:geranylgeranyl pyrophosphate synthase
MQARPATTSEPGQLAAAYTERIVARLRSSLPAEVKPPKRLHQAMHYAVLGTGKYLRPMLVYATGEALGLPMSALDSPAIAIELVHAYSLIHDDLPAMDDDDLRRGRATTHRAFDEATAILAGDALQALAFGILSSAGNETVSSATRLKLVALLAESCGSRGMAGGQAIDLGAVGTLMEQSALERMHGLKTGALIRCAVVMPALLANRPSELEPLAHFGDRIGLAFQVHDDILDVEGETDNLGKTQGADMARNKPTFPACLGLHGSKSLARNLLDESLTILDTVSGNTEMLAYLARFSVERNR